MSGLWYWPDRTLPIHWWNSGCGYKRLNRRGTGLQKIGAPSLTLGTRLIMHRSTHHYTSLCHNQSCSVCRSSTICSLFAVRSLLLSVVLVSHAKLLCFQFASKCAKQLGINSSLMSESTFQTVDSLQLPLSSLQYGTLWPSFRRVNKCIHRINPAYLLELCVTGETVLDYGQGRLNSPARWAPVQRSHEYYRGLVYVCDDLMLINKHVYSCDSARTRGNAFPYLQFMFKTVPRPRISKDARKR